MSERERILASIVGGLLFLLASYWTYNQVEAAFHRRSVIRRQILGDLERKQQTLDAAVRVSRDLERYERMSLPSDVEIARSQYQAWLSGLLTLTNMSDPHVKLTSQSRRANGSTLLTCSVSGKGNVEQWATFLHEFYSTDVLHRIRILPIRPIPDTKLLDVNLTINALILAAAPADQDLDLSQSSRLAEFGADKIRYPIVQRNMFSPPNHPPRLPEDDTQTVMRGGRLAVSLAAEEPDRLDKLTYSLIEGPADARFDPENGSLVWQAKELGEYLFRVRVSDDGIPSATDETHLRVTVVEPPPSPQTAAATAAEEKPRGLDDARFTYVIAAIDISGEPQVWLQIRTKGELLKLRVGDAVKIGSVDGVISKIDDRGFELESAGEHQVVRLGEPLVGPTVTASGS